MTAYGDIRHQPKLAMEQGVARMIYDIMNDGR
jgi:hypothetical protein